MPLVKVVRGEFVDADSYWQNPDGTPIIPSSLVTYGINDYNGNLVLSGTAVQDMYTASIWHAQFTIPDDAPVSLGGAKYRITWSMPKTDGSVAQYIEAFEVHAGGDPIRPIHNTDIIAMEGKHVVDQLILDQDIVLGSLSYKIVDAENREIWDAGRLPASALNQNTQQAVYLSDGTRCYQYSTPGPVHDLRVDYSNGVGPYLGVWVYTWAGSNIPNYECHPIYVVNPKVLLMANNLRKLIDRVKLGDIHPWLRWTDMDLVHYTIRGIQVVNGFPPTQTWWTLSDLPHTLIDLTVKAAAIEALRAQYLAEGYSAFNFGGMGVQLDVDRTTFIDNLCQQLNADLDQRLKMTKRMMTRATGPGIVGVSIGRYTNVMMKGSPWFFSKGWWSMPFPFPFAGGAA